MAATWVVKPRWDDISRAVIRELWAKGESARRIAAELTERGLPDAKPVNRGAVMSVIHRHGYESPMSIKNRPKPVPAAPRPKRSRYAKPDDELHPPTRGPVLPLPPAEGDAARAFGVACRLVELRPTSCRWPLGQTRTPEGVTFCNAEAPKGSYCEIHAQVAVRGSGSPAAFLAGL